MFRHDFHRFRHRRSLRRRGSRGGRRGLGLLGCFEGGVPTYGAEALGALLQWKK